jgi:uncharacterized membrane protein
MYSKVKLLGHPVHPMLVGYPVAFYTASLACYVWYYFHPEVFWFRMGISMNTAGVLTAIAAALPGLIDWLAIPVQRQARKTGFQHMLFNITALLLFVINLYFQCPKWQDVQPYAESAIVLSGLGFTCTIIAGFLGWKMVQKHHAGVQLTPEQQKLETDIPI